MTRGARIGIALFALLLVNSAYLAAFDTPSLFYFANVAAHAIGGVLLAVAAAVYLIRFRPRLSALGTGAAVLLACAAAAGAGLFVVGATTPNVWLVQTHIALAAAGSALVVARRYAAARRNTNTRRYAPLWPVAAAALLAFAVLGSVNTTREFQQRYRIRNPTRPPATMDGEGGGPSGPFFPSSANTTSGKIIPADFFTTSAACGRCHKDIYDQWNSSVHHVSSFNNQWYRKSIEYMQDVAGVPASKWCAGCHDHAVFFNGRFDRPNKKKMDPAEAQAGLACTSCHAIVHVGSSMGQGDFTVEYPPLHDLAASERPVARWVHDRLLYLDPAPHRQVFLKPFHREQTAEFCSTCHKVHLDAPVNRYRWFRGFNEYDNWQASGVSGQGARSFYYPATPQKCADCHMPLVASNDPAAKHGKVRSHRFPGANTAVPFVNHDRVQLKTVQDFLRDGQISVDVFGITRTAKTDGADVTHGAATAEPRLSSTFAVGEESAQFGAVATSTTPPAEVLAPLNRIGAVVRRG